MNRACHPPDLEPWMQRVKSQSALKASSTDSTRGRSPDHTLPTSDTPDHTSSRSPARASVVATYRDDSAFDTADGTGIVRTSAGTCAANTTGRQANAFNAPSSPRGLSTSARSSTALNILQHQMQQSEGEHHPRGHLTWQKRVRFVALRLYHHMASTRVQLLAACMVCILLLALLGSGAGGHRRGYAASARQHEHRAWRYAVYIDGGSSGTRVHVFRYLPAPWPAYVQLDLPEKATSIEPGLSSYAGRPDQAADSLQALVDYALGQVPQHLWGLTPVYLLATAGLRLLLPADAAAILATCSRALAATPLLHRREWARVIPGDAEGLYAWVAANYVTGALEDMAAQAHQRARKELAPSDLYHGVLELGGASFQVTFMPQTWAESLGGRAITASGASGWGQAGPSLWSQVIQLPGVSQRIFTHSYLGLGMDSAMQKAADLVLEQAQHQRKAQRQQQQQEQRRFSQQGGLDSLTKPTGRGDQRPMTEGEGDENSEDTAWDPCLPSGFQVQDGRMGNASFEGCLAVVQQVLPQLLCEGASGAEQQQKQQNSHSRHELHGRHLAGQQHDRQGPKQHSGVGEQGAGAWSETDVGVQPEPTADGHPTGQRRLHKQEGAPHGGRALCTFAGMHIPDVADTNFIALENFFWTARALGLPSRSTLADLRQAGVAHCALPWPELHDKFSGRVPDQFITRYCFGAAYVYALLRDRLGIPEGTRSLLFTNTVRRKRRSVSNGVAPSMAAQGPAAGEGSHGQASQGVAPSAAQAPAGAGTQPPGPAAGSSSSKEVEVGLSWVLGAVLVHAMEAMLQPGGSQLFAQAAGAVMTNVADDEVVVSQARQGARWMALLPVALCLLLVARMVSTQRRAARASSPQVVGSAVRPVPSQQQLWPPLPWSESVRGSAANGSGQSGRTASPSRLAFSMDVDCTGGLANGKTALPSEMSAARPSS